MWWKIVAWRVKVIGGGAWGRGNKICLIYGKKEKKIVVLLGM
jgi:hypothetical protein